MRKFIIEILRFIMPFLVILILGLLVEKTIIDKRLVPGNRYTFQGDWHDLANHNSDVLFVGNSRTWVHLNPFKFSRKFNLLSEVIGQDGQRAHVLFLKLKQYLMNNKNPQFILLQFDPFFYDEVDNLIGYQNYAPYFFNYRLKLMSEFQCKIGYDKYLHYLPLYAYLKSPESLVVLQKILCNEKDTFDFYKTRGFLAQTLKPSFGNNIEWSINPNSKSPYIDSIFKIASINKIKVFGIFTPVTNILYKKIGNIDFLETEFNRLNVKYKNNGLFLQYGNLPMNRNRAFFYNHQHLNKLGSDSFMSYLLGDTIFTKLFIGGQKASQVY